MTGSITLNSPATIAMSGDMNIIGNVKSTGTVTAKEFIKVSDTKYLHTYDITVVDLRHKDAREEEKRIKFKFRGCIELADKKDVKEAIKLRHASDFATIPEVEYMTIFIDNVNSWPIEGKQE